MGGIGGGNNLEVYLGSGLGHSNGLVGALVDRRGRSGSDVEGRHETQETRTFDPPSQAAVLKG